MKPVLIAQSAAEEFIEAVRWYEGKLEGLGGKYYDAVVHAVDVVREHPEIGVAVGGPHAHRQYVVEGFPYKLIYRERVNDLYIVAVAHASRRPGYWKQRR